MNRGIALRVLVLAASCAVSFSCSTDSSVSDESGSGGSTADPVEGGGGHSEGSGSDSGVASGGTTTDDETSGGRGSTDGTGSTNGSGGQTTTDCRNVSPKLSVERLSTLAISELGAPFDTDRNDDEGPRDWATNYGKTPEIIPFVTADALDILFQDQTSSEHAYVVQVTAKDESFVVRAAYRVQSLGRIMGFTKDSAGNYYVASGVDEDDVVDASYPPNKVHRSDIVRIVKFDDSGCVLMESDVDVERGLQAADSEIIVNPMVAASSRLVWGGDRLLLVHGHNTEPDPKIDGTRHQKAISTHINSLDGTVTRSSTMWVSHSFDQRALYDGTGFVELHLGDAYPRSIALGRYSDSGGQGGYPVYHIKGPEGQNNTYTRLGSLLQSDDSTYGYMALFATERSTTTESDPISGTRDVALVRIKTGFASQKTDTVIVEEGAETSAQAVTSSEMAVTNHVRWLTDLGSGEHAERPRMARFGQGEYAVLFERWGDDGRNFEGVFALRVNNEGERVAGPTEVPGAHHISRGDDVVTFDERVVYVTGDSSGLYLNVINSDLSAERILLP